jgi:hypothetical protein
MNSDYQTIIIRSAGRMVGELKTQRKETKHYV